tara:strand:+ start:752 stop:1543 length:792 start_codon:yes stop_codon:yes gene_type:complete
MGKSIGILSIKGGVGKTSSVIALGDAISGFGKKVLLVDGNFSAPNLGIYLKIIDPEKTLHDVLDRSANFKEAIHKFDNFDVLPSAIFNKKEINLFGLRNKIKTLKNKYDIILIDSSPALNEETLAAMIASDELIVVTTPDYATLSMTLKAVKLAKQRKTPINGLILNKVHNKNFELSVDDIQKTTEVPVMAVIPHDINVLKSVSSFMPLTSHKPKSKASIEYKKLAGTLIGEKYKPFSLKNFFKITPKKHEINREIFYKNYFK